MILFINASPKLYNSNSKYFIDLIGIEGTINYLYKENFNIIKKNISICDTIIFVFPLYLDTIPSKLIEFIEFFKNDYKNKNVYIICNCGFLEYKHNNIAVDFMKNYIIKNKGNFLGYLNIGSGEVIGITKKNKLLRILCIDFFKKIKNFRNSVLNNKSIYLSTNINFLPKWLFCIICNLFWKKGIKN